MMEESFFKSANLCVVGNINRDIKTAPLRSGNYLFQDGETSVSSLTETIGGGGANSACAAAALGAKVAFLGKVGTDALGKQLEQTLRRQKVMARLARDKKESTGTSIALTFANGRRHFVSCLPNNQSLDFSDLDLTILPQFNHLLRADIWFSEAMLSGGNEKLFKAARRLGVSVSLDLNWDPLWGKAAVKKIRARKQAVRAVLPLVTLAHGNVRELNEFTDSTDLETSLKRLEKWGTQAVVVHMGKKGAGYYQKGELQIEPSVRVTSPVNSTGTGDVLSVCMMLLHQQAAMSVRERLRLANGVVSGFIEGKRQLIPPLFPAS